jgi:hypothetical protein
MNRHGFFLALLLVVSLSLRLIPVALNRFYFTVDQGRDAVYVREILTNHHLFSQGPETTIRGIYTGPLWYYFLAFGYLIGRGDPRSAVILVILVNVAAAALFLLWLSRKIPIKEISLIATGLVFSWYFYDASRWSFNPFPLVALTLWLVVLLSESLSGRKSAYMSGLIPLFLAVNSNLAGAAALLLFYFIVGCYLAIKNQISGKLLIICVAFLPLLGILFTGQSVLSILTLGQKGAGHNIFTNLNYGNLLPSFLTIAGSTTVPEVPTVGFIIFTAILFLYWKIGRKTIVHTRLALLSLTLLLISYLFFGSNKGWQDWQTVYLPTTLLITILLLVCRLPKSLAFPILSLITISQTLVFAQRYLQYLRPDSDSGILENELKAIDWVYHQSDNDGFAVYTYTRSYFDYPYQYLFWWYGRKTYGYLPCEYAQLPFSDKATYIPGYLTYTKPVLGCDRLRYLIIDSPTNGEKNENWIFDFRNVTKLIETTTIGDITVEKREVTPDYSELYAKNLHFRTFHELDVRIDAPEYWNWEKTADQLTLYNAGRSASVTVTIIGKECRIPATAVPGTITSTSDSDQRIFSFYQPGKVNNYFISVTLRPPLLNASALTDRILRSFQPTEDQNTKAATGCLPITTNDNK